MSYVDKMFKKEVKNLLKTGISEEGQTVRAKWSDGSPAWTIKNFSVERTYDLSKGFPILSIRKQSFKGAVKEALWMFQKKSNNIHDLGLHIWDAWADETGSIGKTYGYTMGEKIAFPEGNMDQIDNLLYKLKNNPLDRRLILQLYFPQNTINTKLPPCLTSYYFMVQGKKLNMFFINRSGDTLSASGVGCWDTLTAGILLYMVARSTGYEPGILKHIVVNNHIYIRHIPIIKKVLKRKGQRKLPKLWLNPEKTDFYSFTPEDFKLIGYNPTDEVDKFEVAV